ncbi:MAG TPA: AAA family ATPase [Saprospiraceae bacterium]|nr:AAA family ATPase [Saprospiraceae bacterium]
MKDKLLPSLPYAVLGFNIEQYNGIKKTEVHDFPSSAKWIFLTGENGYGKTTVLQALAANLYALRAPNIDVYPDNFHLAITLSNHGQVIQMRFRPEDGKLSITYEGEPTGTLQPYAKPIPLCAYGSSRLNVSQTEDDKSLNNPIIGLFDSRTILRNIEFAFSRWFLKKDHDREFKTKFDSVSAVLKKLLPIKEIRVDFKTDKVTYIEKAPENGVYEPVEFSQLASGFKSIIALVGDMILRLFEAQPTIHDPALLEGIVLIDELDLHFHPNIQRALPSLLSEVFPKVQFIATTHSPIPILGAPQGSVFLTVRRNRDEGVTVHRIHLDVSDLTPNLILSSPIFGFDNIFAETYTNKQRIRTEDTLAEMSLNDSVMDRLKSFAASDPDVYERVFKEKPKASKTTSASATPASRKSVTPKPAYTKQGYSKPVPPKLTKTKPTDDSHR